MPERVRMLTIVAAGEPKTQGSKTAGVTKDGRPFLREATSKGQRVWRKIVKEAAEEAIADADWETCHFPVEVEMRFVFERPASHYTTKGDLSASGRKMELPSLDLDKLERAVNDAMTDAGVYDDDKRIRSLTTYKGYREDFPSDFPIDQGVIVTVWYNEKDKLWA